MFETDKLTIFAVITAVAIVCVAGALIFYDDSSDPKITYELNGGVLEGYAPNTYSPGMVIMLPDASKDGWIFCGWLLDEKDDKFFNGDTTGLSGDVTLYAYYEENLSGKWLKFSVYAKYESSPFESYTITGTHTFKYMYYDDEKESYQMHSEYTYIRTDAFDREITYQNEYDYWPSELKRVLIRTWNETISTVDGYKECTVSEYENTDGSLDRFWNTEDNWYPYKWTTVEYIGTIFVRTMETTYTFIESGEDEIPKDCNITVISGNGITVIGNASPYSLGEKATLTANVKDGISFAGWYDSSYQLLSKNPTYTFTVQGSMKLYALNGSSQDHEFDADVMVDLDIEGIFGKDSKFVITNTDTYAVDESVGGLYRFDDAGPYSIMVTDEIEGIEKIYSIKVNGNVTREFTWKYNNSTLTVSIDINYDDVVKARDLYSVEERCFSSNEAHNKSFVTYAYEMEFMKPYLQKLVDKIYLEMKNKGIQINESNAANVILKFVQYIEYQLDEDYKGTLEYWKFPLETLYDQGGDCEDTSILFAAIAYVFKETYYLDYQVGFQVIPQHAIGIIKLSGSKESTNPYGWLYCETTAKKENAVEIGKITSSSVYSNHYGYKTVSEYFLTEKYYKDRYNTCVIIPIG